MPPDDGAPALKTGEFSNGTSGENTAGTHTLDRPALKPLPAAAYVYAQWQERTVGLDYHVEVDHHHYSVPHRLLRQKVWARLTEKTVELFHDGHRVAAHLREAPDRRHTVARNARLRRDA